MQNDRLAHMLAAAFALATLLWGCASRTPPAPPDQLPSALEPTAATVQTLRLDGSSALLPLLRLAADSFQANNPQIQLSVAGSQSLVGRQQTCLGAIDMGSSDVPLSEAEKSAWHCTDAIETPIVVQAFVPVANPHGPGTLRSLTKAQLVAIFSGQITNWKDVGGDDVPIVLINRVPGSGTRANMAHYLFAGNDAGFGVGEMLGANGEVQTAVIDTPGAISYLGEAYVTRGMQALSIDGVAPSQETIAAGTWPITARGYLITRGVGSEPAQAFRTLVTSPAFQHSAALRQLGYLPVTP